jgi:hypothetical protein
MNETRETTANELLRDPKQGSFLEVLWVCAIGLTSFGISPSRYFHEEYVKKAVDDMSYADLWLCSFYQARRAVRSALRSALPAHVFSEESPLGSVLLCRQPSRSSPSLSESVLLRALPIQDGCMV